MAGLTAKQMQQEAKVAYEAIASADAPGYTDRQWSILLTQAQENVVLEVLRLGFDYDELRRRVIQSLIEEKTYESSDISEFTNFADNAYKVSIPSDYFHLVKDTANLTVRVRPVSYDFYHTNIKNPFENPNDDEYWRLFTKEGLIIVTDGKELTSYYLVYIKRPDPIIISQLNETTAIESETAPKDCQLDSTVHRQVVTEAVKLAHAYTSNQMGYQIQSLESNRARYGPQAQQ